MKKFLLASAALITLSATAPALAADLGARMYSKAPMMAPAAVYNWTGFYIGGHIGGAFRAGDDNFSTGVTGGSNDDARFLAGGQIGADYQFAPNWVLGVEGQYSWLDRSNNNAFVFPGAGLGYTYINNQRALASVTGRIGYAWGPALLYVKGGYAYSDNRDNLFFAGAPVASSFDRGHRDGYTVGGGLEYMFAQNWSTKVEYMYYNFDRSNFVTPAVLAPFGSFRNDEHTVKVGLNYRFGFGGPVVARY
jgi:outer membrane immunogenic protein